MNIADSADYGFLPSAVGGRLDDSVWQPLELWPFHEGVTGTPPGIFPREHGFCLRVSGMPGWREIIIYSAIVEQNGDEVIP
jgi:hypothetical protein